MQTLEYKPASKRLYCMECGLSLSLQGVSEFPGTCRECRQRFNVWCQCRRCGRVMDRRERQLRRGRSTFTLVSLPDWCIPCLCGRIQKRLKSLRMEQHDATDDELHILQFQENDLNLVLDRIESWRWDAASALLEDLARSLF